MKSGIVIVKNNISTNENPLEQDMDKMSEKIESDNSL